jgi:hypothetical protein
MTIGTYIDEKININTDHLNAKQFGSFIVFRYCESWRKEIEFNRGTIHYVKDNCLGFGYLNKTSKKIYGMSVFNVPSRILFLLLVLFGMCYVSNNVFESLFFTSIFFLVISFLSYDNDKRIINVVTQILKQHLTN